jgi:hypothetical protein
MQRPTTPMLYWVLPCGERLHRGRPSMAELRAIVRRNPMAWVIT